MTGDARSLDELQYREEFVGRHIGPQAADVAEMLATLGLDSLEALVQSTVPETVRSDLPEDFPAA